MKRRQREIKGREQRVQMEFAQWGHCGSKLDLSLASLAVTSKLILKELSSSVMLIFLSFTRWGLVCVLVLNVCLQPLGFRYFARQCLFWLSSVFNFLPFYFSSFCLLFPVTLSISFNKPVCLSFIVLLPTFSNLSTVFLFIRMWIYVKYFSFSLSGCH